MPVIILILLCLLFSGCGSEEPVENVFPTTIGEPAYVSEEIVWERQVNPYTGRGLYSIAFHDGVLRIRLKLQLVGYPVSDELREKYERGIEDMWSTTRFEIPVVVEVVWTDDYPDQEITIVFGIGRASTIQWYTHGWPDETAAHEAGHYFGLYDEYRGGDAQGFESRPRQSAGLMSNIHRPALDYYYDGFFNWLEERE